MNYENEVWNDVIGTEGMYQLSDNGRYRSRKSGEWKIIKSFPNGVGYLKIYTLFNGVTRGQYLHRAMWEAFVGPIPDGMQIDHINGNRLDNRLCNLRPLTMQENIQSAMDRKRAEGRASSKYIGITLSKNRWKVSCYIEGKQRHVGLYDCEQVARCVSELAREGIYPPNLQKRLAEVKNQNQRGKA